MEEDHGQTTYMVSIYFCTIRITSDGRFQVRYKVNPELEKSRLELNLLMDKCLGQSDKDVGANNDIANGVISGRSLLEAVQLHLKCGTLTEEGPITTAETTKHQNNSSQYDESPVETNGGRGDKAETSQADDIIASLLGATLTYGADSKPAKRPRLEYDQAHSGSGSQVSQRYVEA